MKVAGYLNINLSIICLLAIVNFSYAQNSQEDNREFKQMLNQLDSAIQKFVAGNASEFKAMWSHTDVTTLSGGFGGEIEKGWEKIEQRLAAVASVYPSNTEFKADRIFFKANDGIGYLVQHEFFHFPETDQAVKSTREYRVTMVFQRETNGWRILHRQADAHLTWHDPDIN